MAKKSGEKKEDIEDVEIWNVDETLKCYGRDRLLRSQAEGQFTAIIKFLSDNGMFKEKRQAIDENGKLLIRRVLVRDLTDEGFSFVKAVLKPWFGSKATARDPSNTTILEKYLKEVRK
ncbi:hypothetical protein SAMN05216386_2049 [Nitrosospira briensis]|uniref:Uncharacterized protein n=1 Tax=Nitrosospira briensis TaxID=35799 RepID=A0A1I5CL10_9PROT|nr:hypothetical protein [Nitrosospira briensis]SFN87705.1 hypothetical protein SAMN05216386_2049 [Nitrosospira briensis]